MLWVLTHTMPAFRRGTMRCTRDRSRDHTLAASPKSEPFASRTASSASSNGITVTTGPNTSSRTMRIDASVSTNTVGFTK